MELISIKDTKPYTKLLLYGRAGAGKTRFSADALNPLWYDSESSTETLRHWPEYTAIPVRVPKDPDVVLKELPAVIKEPMIDTIVIDSLTTMVDKLYYSIEHHYGDKRQAYKEVTKTFSKILVYLQEAPINVIVITHRRIVRNEEGRIEAIYPDVTPRLQENVTRLVNVVGYLDIEPSGLKGAKRKLYLNPTPTIEAKNRLNIKETYIENPEFKEIFNV